MLLLVMPLQGIAGSVSHLLCASPSSVEAMDAHHHDEGSVAQEHDHGGGNGNDNISYAGHLSCHQVSSGIPSITAMALVSDVPVYHPSSFSPPRPFFPEQPQRPPRS